MQTIRGTIPHSLKIQFGQEPNPARDGSACIYTPLDESCNGVGIQLAKIAYLLAEANNDLGNSRENGKVTNVDGVSCHLPLMPESGKNAEDSVEILAKRIARLLVPQGWNPE